MVSLVGFFIINYVLVMVRGKVENGLGMVGGIYVCFVDGKLKVLFIFFFIYIVINLINIYWISFFYFLIGFYIMMLCNFYDNFIIFYVSLEWLRKF